MAHSHDEVTEKGNELKKLLLMVPAIALVLTSTMGASGGCGSTTDKHKIRKQPVYVKCHKGYVPNSKGKCVKKPAPSASCKKRINGTYNCKK